MTGVQLIGSKAVLTRYEKFSTDAWALYQGKQFIVGGVGADNLTEWVRDFEAAGSTATYTLRVYDSDEVPTSATAGVDYIASVNFKVVDQYEGYGIAGHSNKLMERIKGLEEKLEKKGDDEENDEGPALGDGIMGWFEQPEKLGMIIVAVKQLFGGVPAPVIASPAPVQTISGFEPNKNDPMSTEESLNRLSKAIDILAVHDPNLVVHLEKLAKLAETDKLLFTAIISKLDAL